MWRLLHGAGFALHVHEYVGHAQLCHGTEHLVIKTAAGDIIDNVCPVFLNAHFRHAGTKGVYRDYGFWQLPPENPQAVAQAVHLFLFCHVVSSRSRRISANVYHRAPFTDYLMTAGNDAGFILPTATGVKRVGSKIQDAHYLRSAQVEEAALTIDGIHDGVVVFCRSIHRQFFP